MKIGPIFEELDDYSSFKNVKPYLIRKEEFMNSIKSFNDIKPDLIPLIIDYFGHEGFNSEDEAIEDLNDKINSYKNFSNPVTLYRIVGVKNRKLIRTSDMGEHFTPYEWNLDSDMLFSIGYDNWDNDIKPYVMVVSVPLSEINVWQTIIQNLAFPNEHEINLKNKGRGAKIIKIYKLI